MIDDAMMEEARRVAASSLDPSTQTGCVIVDVHGEVIGRGWNRFPGAVRRTNERNDDRPTRLAMTVHAEIAAIISAGDCIEEAATAYIYPWPPCSQCAGALIEAGITRVVAPEPTAEQRERWGRSFEIMEVMLNEAGVVLDPAPIK